MCFQTDFLYYIIRVASRKYEILLLVGFCRRWQLFRISEQLDPTPTRPLQDVLLLCLLPSDWKAGIYRINISEILQRQGDEVFAEVQLSVQQADDGAHAAFFIGDAVQNVELCGHACLGHGGHFDLHGIQDAVFLDDEVDLSVDFGGFSGPVLLFPVPAVVLVHVEIIFQPLVGI